jgi:hypothetical protein
VVQGWTFLSVFGIVDWVGALGVANPGDSHDCRYGGRMFAASEIALIREVVATYTGACYRAANGVEIGETSGRGRDHRQHRRHGTRPKWVFVHPLRRDARARLRGEGGPP